MRAVGTLAEKVLRIVLELFFTLFERKINKVQSLFLKVSK